MEEIFDKPTLVQFRRDAHDAFQQERILAEVRANGGNTELALRTVAAESRPEFMRIFKEHMELTEDAA